MSSWPAHLFLFSGDQLCSLHLVHIRFECELSLELLKKTTKQACSLLRVLRQPQTPESIPRVATDPCPLATDPQFQHLRNIAHRTLKQPPQGLLFGLLFGGWKKQPLDLLVLRSGPGDTQIVKEDFVEAINNVLNSHSAETWGLGCERHLRNL